MNISSSTPRLLPKGAWLSFALLSSLFFLWAIPNNLTDTMLAAFKRIMSLSDTRTAWIQVVCYLLGYGCCAVPAALFIKRHSYKSGVLLGLSFCIAGGTLFYPAMWVNKISSPLSFGMYLFAIFVLFAGLSVLETSANSYVYALGDPRTATRRLNLAQSFNPFGALTGVILSQVFVLSRLHTLTADERMQLTSEDLQRIQGAELQSVTTLYLLLAGVMCILLVLIFLAKIPVVREQDSKVDLKASVRRLMRNRNYVWGVVAQFFNIGAQIAVWSFLIRYAIEQLDLESIVHGLGTAPSAEELMRSLREEEPIAASFYSLCEASGLDVLLPRTAEQAGATYYILSLVLFVFFRFFCTWLMRYIRPARLLAVIALVAVGLSLITVYATGPVGLYALVGISGCLSLMFPTIYGLGLRGLGEDTKLGGSGMVMAIAGAAVLTQIQGILSDQSGSIKMSYWVPAFAFAVIAYYGFFVASRTVWDETE